MQFGSASFGEVPFGALVPSLDASTADPLQILDQLELQWLMRAVGWDPDAGAEVEVYVSSSGYTSVSEHTARGVAAHTPCPDGLKASDNVEVRVFSGGKFVRGAVAGFGSVKIANADRRHDLLRRLHLEDRRVDFWVGPRDWIGPELAAFADRYAATVAKVDGTADEITLGLRDLGHLFQHDCNPRAYLGLGVAVRLKDSAAHVSIPHDPRLEASELGMEFIVQPKTLSAFNLADKGGVSGYRLKVTAVGAVEFEVEGTVVASTADSLVPAGEPTRVSFFGDGTGTRVLVDGLQAASDSNPYTGPTPGGPLKLGEGLVGVLDDVRVWREGQHPPDKVIERDARRELVAPSTASLYGYYRFSTGTGTTAFNEFQPPPTPLASPRVAPDGTLVGNCDWIGFEGTSGLSGKRIPTCRGVRRQVVGVLEDPQRVVYRVHIGQCQSIVPMQNGYPSLEFGGDFADIYDAVTEPGKYYTSLATGRCRFHDDEFAGTITFDVEGDAEGGYVSAAPDIMRRLAVAAGFSGQIEEITVRAATELRPGPVGFSTGTEPVKYATALSELAETIDGWYLVEFGDFAVGTRFDPDKATVSRSLGVDDVIRGSVKESSARPPTRQLTVRYRERGYEHKYEETSGLLEEDEKLDLTQRWRTVETPDLKEVGEAHKDAEARTVDTLWDDDLDAQADSDRRIDMDRHAWRSISLSLGDILYVPRIGSVVRLTLPYLDLEDGQNFLVVGWKRSSGPPGLILWGRKNTP